ncbi:hypothetical protein GCM10018793_00400 [Streptomyces sulfonofaciens]|uniref:Uncharacterized protein n=1 Tax=Streptomyces sulfonofaciens TaxID=68272 RepID=A0A919FMI9_9ACTN|nr:hypothetical protein [Streptomyces sulfonofaciens]GHH68901.1 hypothetical protein GCM10018793_00400 [Streptomyces sulfonofaciens]
MPRKTAALVIASLTGAAALTAGLLALAAPAGAAALPCNLSSSGGTASATCFSGSSYTWRLVADCDDVSDPRSPSRVTTLYGDWRTGDGTETLTCDSGLRATGHLEAR